MAPSHDERDGRRGGHEDLSALEGGPGDEANGYGYTDTSFTWLLPLVCFTKCTGKECDVSPAPRKDLWDPFVSIQKQYGGMQGVPICSPSAFWALLGAFLSGKLCYGYVMAFSAGSHVFDLKTATYVPDIT